MCLFPACSIGKSQLICHGHRKTSLLAFQSWHWTIPSPNSHFTCQSLGYCNFLDMISFMHLMPLPYHEVKASYLWSTGARSLLIHKTYSNNGCLISRGVTHFLSFVPWNILCPYFRAYPLSFSCVSGNAYSESKKIWFASKKWRFWIWMFWVEHFTV